MASIKFIQLSLLYHVFDIKFLSSKEDKNLSNIVLELQEPFFVCDFDKKDQSRDHKNSLNSTKLLSSSRLPNTVDINSDVSNFNGMVGQDLLLHNTIKAKQKKRIRSKNSLHSNIKNINNADDNFANLVRRENKLADKHLEKLSYKNNTQSKSTKTSNGKPSITITQALTIHALSQLISIPQAEIIKFLFIKGIKVTINQMIGIDLAVSVAENYGFTVVNSSTSVGLFANLPNRFSVNDTDPRIPIITMLGDVKSGKTSLLHKMCNSTIRTIEEYQITQSIEVSEPELCYNNKKLRTVVLDIPGHKAFKNMRSIGLKVADLIILVIDPIDGISNHTIELIKIVKAENLPALIVFSKIDIVPVNSDSIKHSIITHNPEFKEWLENVETVAISSLTNTNIDMLMSKMICIIERLELKANVSETAEGIVYNAFLDKNKGITVDIIVQNGTLHIYDFIVAGSTFGKVRVMKGNENNILKLAKPSSPVKVWGLSAMPYIGSNFTVTPTEKEAKKLAHQCLQHNNILLLQKQINSRAIVDPLGSLQETIITSPIKLILKADTQGSIEAVLVYFLNIMPSTVSVQVVAGTLGRVTEADIKLAIITKAVIIGFKTTIGPNIETMIEKSNITIHMYETIYDLIKGIEDSAHSVKTAVMPIYTGIITVCSVFSISAGMVAGCVVDSGEN